MPSSMVELSRFPVTFEGSDQQSNSWLHGVTQPDLGRKARAFLHGWNAISANSLRRSPNVGLLETIRMTFLSGREQFMQLNRGHVPA